MGDGGSGKGEFDVDDDIACGNGSFCQLLLSNGELEEEQSFRFNPSHLFQHKSSPSCCSSSSSGLLCFGADEGEGEVLLFPETRNAERRVTRKASTCAPFLRKREVSEQESKPNSKRRKTGNPSSNGLPKARKEKLGERIAALQQLVSPFGKTDTASVLHEAMGYIKFLHEQVQVLCSPYLQHRLPPERGHEEEEETRRKGELRSRGLCLVPVACCMDVQGSCIGADFWSPSSRH